MCRLYAIFVDRFWLCEFQVYFVLRPCPEHVWIMCWLCVDYVGIIHRPWIDNMRTLWDHVRVVLGSCADNACSIYEHMRIKRESCVDPVCTLIISLLNMRIIWKRCLDNMRIICVTYVKHIWNMCESCVNHERIMCRPACLDTLWNICWSCADFLWIIP